jgi:hypothetical protein
MEYKVGDTVKLCDKRGPAWARGGEMDKYINTYQVISEIPFLPTFRFQNTKGYLFSDIDIVEFMYHPLESYYYQIKEKSEILKVKRILQCYGQTIAKEGILLEDFGVFDTLQFNCEGNGDLIYPNQWLLFTYSPERHKNELKSIEELVNLLEKINQVKNDTDTIDSTGDIPLS